jgi:presenilin-like A22 family membrane protease
MNNKHKTTKVIYTFQIISISLIWMFVFGITWWILRLLITSINLRDAIDASVGISILVIPIFITLASILTYVFIGLQRNRHEKEVKTGGNK